MIVLFVLLCIVVGIAVYVMNMDPEDRPQLAKLVAPRRYDKCIDDVDVEPKCHHMYKNTTTGEWDWSSENFEHISKEKCKSYDECDKGGTCYHWKKYPECAHIGWD
jgi:hypothetical protein